MPTERQIADDHASFEALKYDAQAAMEDLHEPDMTPITLVDLTLEALEGWREPFVPPRGATPEMVALHKEAWEHPEWLTSLADDVIEEKEDGTAQN